MKTEELENSKGAGFPLSDGLGSLENGIDWKEDAKRFLLTMPSDQSSQEAVEWRLGVVYASDAYKDMEGFSLRDFLYLASGLPLK